MRRRLFTVFFIGINLFILSLLSGITPASAPAQAQSSLDLDALENCDFSTSNNIGLEIGAVVVHLNSGRGCAENLDVVFNTASVGKIFVLGAYLEQVVQGNRSYDQKMTFTELYLMGGRNDCLSDDDLGVQYSLGELSEFMIACSDNAATWMIMDTIGWDTVQAYIDSLGIDGIGEVIPYSEVDRRKLALIDETWETVPRAYASQYMRRRDTTNLGRYFSELPDYSRVQRNRAALEYYETYTTNTTTPRAMAQYLLKLRDDLKSSDYVKSQTAQLILNTLLLTDRQFSMQSFPGTVYIGAKNGFDTGLRAEVSFVLENLANHNRVADALVIVFTRQPDFDPFEVELPNDDTDRISQYLLDLSADLSAMLYPDYVEPPVIDDPRVTAAVFQTDDLINQCWFQYWNSGFDQTLVAGYEGCLNSVTGGNVYSVGDRLTLGMTIRDNNFRELRVVFVYTQPDGTKRSYQTESFYQNDVGFNWFHPVNQVGTWTIDVYVNFDHVVSRTVQVN